MSVQINDYVENKTFEEINVGDKAHITAELTKKEIQIFAIVSGDINPAHLDEEYASKSMFHKLIAHGMWTGSLVSAVLGTRLPGPGTIYLGQSFKFLKPVGIGDVITAEVTVKDKKTDKNTVVLECVCTNQENKKVLVGEAEVMAPKNKVIRKTMRLPEVVFTEENTHRYYDMLLKQTRGLAPLKVGVVHAVDPLSIEGAVLAANDLLIDPIFIGPKDKVQHAASIAGVDIHNYKIIDTANSADSTRIATEMAEGGSIEALMKGAVYTEELLRPILKTPRLLTDRQISHVFILDVPTYHKPLYLTDVAVNIAPGLREKRDIVQNAIDLFHMVEGKIPKVAIVSATESVNEDIPSTLDATALCKMAQRGQIVGGILDGPLAFDNAISKEAAEAKGIKSAVAGDADIIVAPDLEAGNLLLKQLRFLAGAEGAGIALGCKVPIIMTSRASLAMTRRISCAFCLLLKRNKFPGQQNKIN